MPNNSKSNSINNNNSSNNQSLELINEKWALEEKYFKDTLMAPVEIYNLEKKRSTFVRSPYPRIKPIEQLGWEKFYTKIIDPVTGKPYEELDNKGRETIQSDGLGPIRHYVRTIIRYRAFDDREYLLTLGTVYGFNSFGKVIDYYVHRPESFTKTSFDSRRKYNEKDQTFSEVTTGIIGSKEIYTLPFNEDNLDSLISNNTVNKNTPSAYIEKMTLIGQIEISNPCNFVVKSYNGESRAVEGKTFQERLQRFRDLSFDELFEFKYLKPKEDHNNNTSVNNTQHFK